MITSTKSPNYHGELVGEWPKNFIFATIELYRILKEDGSEIKLPRFIRSLLLLLFPVMKFHKCL